MAIHKRSDTFWYGVNDIVWGSNEGGVGLLGSVGKCWGRCGEGVS